MKREKDIVEFFNHYSKQMLPEDGEQFMKNLKQNMDRLPIPSAFNEMNPETSEEYGKWLLEKMKKDYKRSKRDALISCILTSVTIAAVLLVISALGVFDINTTITVGVLTAVALVSIGFIYSVVPFHTRGL